MKEAARTLISITTKHTAISEVCKSTVCKSYVCYHQHKHTCVLPQLSPSVHPPASIDHFAMATPAKLRMVWSGQSHHRVRMRMRTTKMRKTRRRRRNQQDALAELLVRSEGFVLAPTRRRSPRCDRIGCGQGLFLLSMPIAEPILQGAGRSAGADRAGCAARERGSRERERERERERQQILRWGEHRLRQATATRERRAHAARPWSSS